MRVPALFLILSLSSCLEHVPEHIALLPAAEQVDFALDAPSPNSYMLIGEVIGIAAANDPDAAQEAAKNDLRNKAAALGASLVTIDENTGEPLPLQDKVKVKLVGRAYKPVD